MSKFIDAVKAELLTERRPVFHPLLSVEKSIEEVRYGAVTYGYSIAVTFGRTGFCDPKDLDKLTDNIVRDLRETVYGDIKQRIIRLERAIYEQDKDAALSEIRDINQEIFG